MLAFLQDILQGTLSSNTPPHAARFGLAAPDIVGVQRKPSLRVSSAASLWQAHDHDLSTSVSGRDEHDSMAKMLAHGWALFTTITAAFCPSRREWGEQESWSNGPSPGGKR
jgi:hypothetical protein